MKGTLVLLRPVITERSMTETNNGRYTFAVDPEATKHRIGRKPDWKKAIVTIASGQKIEKYFVEGV
ncbi:MAG: 50S ribosomal protein L23 [Chloroflexi bacterium]|nr:MAG: 50S ribosomal protein L23 [Chloroflexota bacterium]